MTVRLLITVSFKIPVDNFLNKIIEIPDNYAKEKHIKNGDAGILLESEDSIKISYRGSLIELSKNKIKVLKND